LKARFTLSTLMVPILTGVYAFGFLFMLPQLFVNYKVSSIILSTSAHVFCYIIHEANGQMLVSISIILLFQQFKSVAHLPWKAFMYKVSG
jgi:hypothetical protein